MCGSYNFQSASVHGPRPKIRVRSWLLSVICCQSASLQPCSIIIAVTLILSWKSALCTLQSLYPINACIKAQQQAACAAIIVSVCLSVCLVTVHFSSGSRSTAGALQDVLQLLGTGCVWLPHCKYRIHLITMPIQFTPLALHSPACLCRCQGSCTVIRHWPPRNPPRSTSFMSDVHKIHTEKL